MKYLIIGSGGREHALAKAIADSAQAATLYAAPGNPGIAAVAECVNLDCHRDVAVFCREHAIDLVVVGPENPLAEGIADSLRAENIAVFGPGREAARLEASKGFAKEFMERHNIPTARFQRFTIAQREDARKYVRSHPMPVVIKADGLAAGKGVIIAHNADEAMDTVEQMFDGLFGSAGASLVVEEFLAGQEASVFAVCDGERYILLAPSQDHKQAYDGDKGPNTGGMGAYAPAALVNDAVLAQVRAEIVEPVLRGMRAAGTPFIGCLFCGLMVHEERARVVEFNVRFGDPETQVVLPLIKGDIGRLLHSAATGRLDERAVESVAEGYACCVVLASEGYPGSYVKGLPISGIAAAEATGATVYHAGTRAEGDTLLSAGGRVLGVSTRAHSLAQAVAAAYRAVERIDFRGKMYRRDIGSRPA